MKEGVHCFTDCFVRDGFEVHFMGRVVIEEDAREERRATGVALPLFLCPGDEAFCSVFEVAL